MASALLAMSAPGLGRAVTLAPQFGDHAVLQGGQPVPIWGTAAAGEGVAVTFRGARAAAVAGPDGRWSVLLPPMQDSTQPAVLTAAGTTTATARDVLVGEVWLASGQSNMELPLTRAADAAAVIAAARFPEIRELKVERAVAPAPAESIRTGGWRPASPETAGDFSAVAYFFARELWLRTGRPVGIINSTYGGTEIESWLGDAARRGTSLAHRLEARWQAQQREWPPERVAQYPGEMARWQQAEAAARKAGTPNPLTWPQPPATPDSPRRPGGLYNGMIAPLAPGALRGVLWYQGESNVGRADEYGELFAALIRSWRERWGRPDLPFYFVQLPNFADDGAGDAAWPRLREAQASALSLPATGLAVTIDVGRADNLHPPDKADVGRRLARLALARVYGMPVEDSGPEFSGATVEGSAMRVRFTHAAGLRIRHGSPPTLQLAGSDRVFHPAAGRVENGTLLVSSPAVPAPVAVRYAWMNAPETGLENGAGLPAAPFRSDQW
ncbi:MAG TPA: sialate O-acetylesterase [Opitutaceae bacterium]|jgi:sialate O-acetylesterase|nr:sialate O-acetylesterase [Opitutaceae bacterium]